MDAIAIYQAGLKSVVATLGTSFTEDQISSLWRLTPEPLVCFDSDRAGIAAAHRSIDRILPALKVGQSFRFAFIQEGKDPDELIREKGLMAFKSVLQDSKPLWDVLWEREVHQSHIKLDSPDARAALEHKLYAIIRTINDPIVQAQYRGTCRVDLSELFWQTARARLDNRKGKSKRFAITIAKEGHRHELQKISWSACALPEPLRREGGWHFEGRFRARASEISAVAIRTAGGEQGGFCSDNLSEAQSNIL